ncbi:MAG TPA: carbon starvation CstA family protein, partial [Gemmatimonadaceae bacterium]|nr:carbon starvation CstA family protein [Gemmatimonadaceae bacterium]
KIGVIAALALGIVIVLPPMQMPALTQFANGEGPIFAGKIFPFAFITIACGSISGFHALISSGTTPKLLASEGDARMIGYGGMLMESLVAVMALIAACVLTPGVYFAINAPASAIGTTAASAATAVQHWGFTLDPAQMQVLAQNVGEKSLLSRTGGAPSLAVGMAHLFSSVLGGPTAMALWYHFAIMFEALFILTTVDAGTRVGRFMLQDLLKHVWAPIGRVSWYPAVLISSALIVAMWGHFLYQGVMDPLGGINSLWPLFGISNQLLAAVALCVGTTVIIKMGKARYAWVTILPLVWLVIVTMTAGWQKIFASDPKLGFFSHMGMIQRSMMSGGLPPGVHTVADAHRLIANDWIDAAVAAFFLLSVVAILIASIHEWFVVLTGRKAAKTTEIPFEPSRAA